MQKQHMTWVFVAVIAGTAVLVALGKLPSDTWKMALAMLGAWMVPSPIVPDVSKAAQVTIPVAVDTPQPETPKEGQR